MKKVQTITTRQYRLYDYLCTYCVGYENIKPRRLIAKEINKVLANDNKYDEKIGKGVDTDMEVLKNHPTITKYICSNTKGYYLPKNEDELKYDFCVSRVVGGIETTIRNGIVSADYYFKVLNEYKDMEQPIHNQQRMTFASEKDHITRYGDDLEKLSLKELSNILKEYIGYGLLGMTKEQYIEEIKKERKLRGEI